MEIKGGEGKGWARMEVKGRERKGWVRVRGKGRERKKRQGRRLREGKGEEGVDEGESEGKGGEE